MKPGDSFHRDGSIWLIKSAEQLRNKTFQWWKVVVHWSGFGPRPNWAGDDHTFYTAHERIP